jgi:hypothetical protein
MISPATRTLSLIALIVLAICTRKGPIQAMSLVTFVILFNRAFAPERPVLDALRWVLPLACAVRVSIDYRPRSRATAPWKWPLAFYAAVILLLVIAVSSNPELSILKLGSWFAVTFVALLAFEHSGTSPKYWFRWFYSLYCATLLFSLPLLLVSAGRFANGTGFQGIFWHPQSFGVYIAPFTAVVTASLLFGEARGWLNAILASLGWYMVFASRCRTAALAVCLGLALSLLIMAILRPDLRRRLARSGVVIGIFALSGASILGIGFYGEQISEEVGFFSSKGKFGGLTDLFAPHGLASSRSAQVSQLLATISDAPLAGTGFGLSARSIAQDIERDETFGVPVGAYTEQGFLPLAVMAQTGIIGSAAWLIMFFAVCRPVVRRGSLLILVLFWSSFFINFGEMVFFASGGLGAQLWLLFGLCLSASAKSDATVTPSRTRLLAAH